MKILRILLGSALCLLGLLVALPFLSGPSHAWAVLTRLPFGWWRFLQRNIAQLHFNATLLLTGLACSAALLALLHLTLRSLLTSPRSHPGDSPAARPGRWRWRWSLAAYAALWILFLTAFGSAGLLRHGTWLLEDPRPWFEERLYPALELRRAESAVEMLLREAGQDLDATRKALATECSLVRYQRLLSDDFDVLLFGDAARQVAAYVVIPRDPRLQTRGGFRCRRRSASSETLPQARLAETIRDLEHQFPERRPG